MADENEEKTLAFIENEGALFRGPIRSMPEEVWSPKRKDWVPYTGQVPKPIEWGNLIDEAEAQAIMAETGDSEEPRQARTAAG